MLENDLLKVKKAQKELELLSNDKRDLMLKNIADSLKENKIVWIRSLS